MRALFLAISLLLLSGAAASATMFSCDVNRQECKCDGIWGGADCQAMKKNCRDGGSGYNCYTEPGHPPGCWCSMAKAKPKVPKGNPMR